MADTKPAARAGDSEAVHLAVGVCVADRATSNKLKLGDPDVVRCCEVRSPQCDLSAADLLLVVDNGIVIYKADADYRARL